jgi:dihydrofolate reductase
MRKVILNVAVSLDGYIEGPNGEYDWCFNDQDYGLTEFFGEVDALFLGRKSYETLISAEENPFPGVKKYVFSDTLAPIQHEEIEIVSKAGFQQAVTEIMNMEGGNIWLFGGASLVSSFQNAGLITDYMLSVHPVILGEGKPLFQHISQRTELLHTGTQTYSSGLVQLHYTFKPRFDYDLLKDSYKRSKAFGDDEHLLH